MDIYPTSHSFSSSYLSIYANVAYLFLKASIILFLKSLSYILSSGIALNKSLKTPLSYVKITLSSGDFPNNSSL